MHMYRLDVGRVDKTKMEQSYTYPINLTSSNFKFSTTNAYVIRIDFIGYKSFNITKEF